MQTIAISIEVNNSWYSVASIYCPTNSTPSFTKAKFKFFLESLPKPTIISGDLNAHHTMWGCTSTNTRGKDILDCLDECNLVLLNDKQVTTVGSHIWRPNGLDLTMVSPSISLKCEWSVHDDPLGSYHLPTFTKINTKNSSSTPSGEQHAPIDEVNKLLLNRINLRLVNWDLYSETVNRLLLDFEYDVNEPLNNYNRFCKIILTAVERSVPRRNLSNSGANTSKRHKHIAVPWWNNRCATAVNDSKAAYLRFKQNPTLDNYINFKRVQAVKKLVIKQVRQQGWQEFCSKFNRLTPISTVWQNMRKLNSKHRQNHFKDISWVNDFLRKYTPDFVHSPFDDKQFNSVNSCPKFLTDPFSIDEISSAVKSRKDTASGLDRLTYNMFRLLNKINLTKLLQIFNDLWKDCIIPPEWKMDCLIPVIKPGKDPTNFDSYRPITLTSCAGKLFEQLIKQRLEFFIESNSILPSNQFGFRRGYSARESLANFYVDLSTALNNDEYVLSVFLDVVGAFNNVNLTVLSSILSSFLPMKLIEWIYNFLSNREVYVKVNSKLIGPRLSSKGVCQGGILSPLLYILYIYKLNSILGNSVNNLQFADDLLIYIKGKNIIDMQLVLNESLKRLEKYFSLLSLDISLTKSKVVVFHQVHKYVPLMNIIYNNQTLPTDCSVKFLGVIFHQNLKWDLYVDCLVDRALRATNIIRSVIGRNWGADPKIILLLYKSLVRSNFDYAFFCYASEHKLVEKLEKIQNMNLRLILGAMYTSPIISMQVECNLPPILLRFEYLKLKFLFKVFSVSNNPLILKLLNCPISMFLNKTIVNDLNLRDEYNIYSSKILPCYNGLYESKFCKIKIVIRKDIKEKHDMYETLSEFIDYRQIYTDGSKNALSTSVAFYDLSNRFGHGYKISTLASIYTAEAKAIFLALEYIEKQVLYSKWIIITDSMSVLMALKNNTFISSSNYLIQEIRNKYYHLCTIYGKDIIFIWTPSHIGVFGNEQVDTLAKIINSSAARVQDLPLCYSDCSIGIHKIVTTKWEEHWTQILQTKGKWYRKINWRIGKPWFCKGKDTNRKFYTNICRLRIGHGHFNEHLHRMGMIASPSCTWCNSNTAQSLHHLFFDCSEFVIQRHIMFDELRIIFKKPENIPHSIPLLLRFPSCFKAIFTYITTTFKEL